MPATEPDLLSPAAIEDPYAVFGALREEDPVHWNEGQRSWVLTRYEDVAAAFTDARLSSNRVQAVYDSKLSPAERESRAPTFRILADWMVFLDPPAHTRMRNLVKRAFTPRAVTALEPRIERIVDQVLDLPDSGKVDVVHDIAYPIPALVVAEMLGVPAEDRELFRAWSKDISTVIFQAQRSEQDRLRSQRGLVALAEFLRELVRAYRRRPADNLITSLIEARARDGTLSEDEIVSTCVLLLFAGHETTTNLIANGFLALLRNPEQADALRAEPALAEAAVDEVNRYDGPAKLVVRRCAEPIELRGRTIEPESKVLLVQCSADRDPRRFERPDEFDLRRADNRNVGFGFGIHYCLGAPLARLEARLALPRMLERLPRAEIASRRLTHQPLLLTRSLDELPIRYG